MSFNCRNYTFVCLLQLPKPFLFEPSGKIACCGERFTGRVDLFCLFSQLKRSTISSFKTLSPRAEDFGVDVKKPQRPTSSLEIFWNRLAGWVVVLDVLCQAGPHVFSFCVVKVGSLKNKME